MGPRGAGETLAVSVPHAIVERPVLWLTGAVGLRVSHGLWKVGPGEGGDTSGPRLLAEALVRYGVALALLGVAAVVTGDARRLPRAGVNDAGADGFSLLATTAPTWFGSNSRASTAAGRPR